MTHRIDRRTFLALGVGAVAWACGTGDERAEVSSPSPGAGAAGALSVVLTTPPNGAFGVGDRRIAFALIRENQPVTPEGTRVELIPSAGEAPDAITPDVIEIGMGQGGESDTQLSEIFAFRHELTEAGFWALRVEAGDERADASFEVVEAEQAETPLTGEPAIAVPSPTTADPLGVDPVCTRTPACSMHAITIADAVASGQPTVITFATPRFCTSRTCGPVVDNVEDAKDAAGEGVNFIHVEIWKDTENVGDPAFYVEAFTAYTPASEPLTLFVDADGILRARWYGALGSEEVLEATEALRAGEL